MKRILCVCGLDKRIKTAPLPCAHARTDTEFIRVDAGSHFVIVGIDKCLDCGEILTGLPEGPLEALQKPLGSVLSDFLDEKVI